MNPRCFLILSALLLFAIGAYAGGTYQHTKDGKTLVWNNYPKPNDAAKWSGDRDADRYATGYGTLTWYTVKRAMVTGSILPSVKYMPIGRYSGNMVRGKLDGSVVTVNANGRTFHAAFVDGRKTTAWVAGPVPIERKRNEPSHEEAVVEVPTEGPPPVADQKVNEPVHQDTVVEAPAEGPALAQRSEDRSQKPEINERPVPASAAAETSSPASDSLRSLTSPPSTLRINLAAASPQAPIPSTASSSSARSRLSQAEVIELANAEARRQGYDLNEYQRPRAHYTAADETWSIFYDQKDIGGIGENGKQFSVSVEDKTKKTSVVIK